VVSVQSPHFEVAYILKNPSFHFSVPTVGTTICNSLSWLMQYFTHRYFKGSVKFFIESRVHNKDLIEQKKKDVLLQMDNLAKVKEELDYSKEKKTLSDVIQHVIDKTKGDIEKLEWIKSFQEKITEFLERKVKSKTEDEGEPMNMESVIKGCRPIVEDFFKQKDGIMVEFLRTLDMKHEKKENVDITSFFNDCVGCAKCLEPFHESMKTLLITASNVFEIPEIDDFQKAIEQSSTDGSSDHAGTRIPTRLCEIKPTVQGNVIEFTWNIPEDEEVNAKDWIGLFIHDREHSNKYESSVYLEGKRNGKLTFSAPGNGYFDLRFYQKNGREEKSRSEPFLVGPMMEVKAERENRRKINVTWNRDLEEDGDWIGIYEKSTLSNARFIQQLSVSSANNNGVLTFDSPRKPGMYEIRYFFSSKRHGTGYAYSGKTEIEIPDEDGMYIMTTHPVLKVHWQVFSCQPSKKAWIGLFESSDEKAKRLGFTYLLEKGLLDVFGDNGYAEIEVKELSSLKPGDELPEGSDKWELRLFTQFFGKPAICIPFIKKQCDKEDPK